MLKEQHCLRVAGLAGVTTLHWWSCAVRNRSSALIAEEQPGVAGREPPGAPLLRWLNVGGASQLVRDPWASPGSSCTLSHQNIQLGFMWWQSLLISSPEIRRIRWKRKLRSQFLLSFPPLGNSVSPTYLDSNKQDLLDFNTELSAVRIIVQLFQVRKHGCSLIKLVLFLQAINPGLSPTLNPQNSISYIFARPAVSWKVGFL